MQNVQKTILLPIEKYERLVSGVKSVVHQQHQTNFLHPPILQEGSGQDRLSVDVILSALPKPYRQRGRALLQHIQQDPEHHLSWDEKGHLIYKGQTIQRSHVSDLLKDSQYLYKSLKPIGKEAFYNALKEMNIPRGLIGNHQRLEDMGMHLLSGGERPPGISVQRQKYSSKKKTFKWIAL
jgi:hypothetical protein